MVKATPKPLTLGKKTSYTLYRRLRGPQGRSGRVREVLPPTGIRSPDHPARSESLCTDYDMPADSCSKAWGKTWNVWGTSLDFGFSSFREVLGSVLGLRQAILTDRFLGFSPPVQANFVIEPQIRHRPPPHTSFPNHRSLVSCPRRCMYLTGATDRDVK